MNRFASIASVVLALATGTASTVACAALPAPTAQQQQADAAKTQAAAAETAQAKAALSASMDGIVTRWRAGAAQNGWRTYPATVVQAPSAAQAAAPAPPAPVHSEKQGSAAPSADVKDPSRKGL